MTAATLLDALFHAQAEPARPVALRAGETLRLEPRRARLTLRSDRGTLVVTQTGDPVDHVLAPGQRFSAHRAGRVVVWALSDAALTVERRRWRSPVPAEAQADACAPSCARTDPRARRPG
jgi:hypothetical protein